MKNIRDTFVLVVSCLSRLPYYIKCFGIPIVASGLLVVSLIGCAQTTETATTTTTCTSTTTTTVAAGGTVAISGSLKAGTLSIASAKASGIKSPAVSFGAIPSYNVVAVSKDTGKIYFAPAETDSSGNFTIPNLPAAESFYLEVLDSDNKLAAPITLGSEGGKAVMAVAPGASNLNLGDINYDSSKGCAAATMEPTSHLDLATSVEVKSGETLVPKGAGNFGKASITELRSTYDPDVADGDGDGLPNILDADNNGDLVADEFDGMYTREVLSGVEPANFHSYVFTNLKVDYDQRNTFQQDYTQFNIAIGVQEAAKNGITPKSLSAKSIQSVKVVDGPAWIQKAEIEGTSTLWSANNYNLPLKSATPEGIYEVHVDGVKPLTDVNAGDILKLSVTYTDGTSEEAAKMLNFIFTDIPRVNAYKLGNGAWQTVNGTGPGTATTTEVTLRWTRPKDENSNEIKGGKYTFEYNTTGAGAFETTIIGQDTNEAVSSLEGYCDFAKLENISFSNNELFIGVCVRSLANDNSAENLRFTKGW